MMSDFEWDVISKIVLMLIEVIVPPLLVIAIRQFTRWLNMIQQRDDWEFIQQSVWTAIHAAEQLGLTGDLEQYAAEKLEFATAMVNEMLAQRGIKIDVNEHADLIRGMIEAALREVDFPNVGPATAVDCQ